jgi:hypothetical protein
MGGRGGGPGRRPLVDSPICCNSTTSPLLNSSYDLSEEALGIVMEQTASKKSGNSFPNVNEFVPAPYAIILLSTALASSCCCC